MGLAILYTEPNIKWTNLASHNAGVTVSIICITRTLDKDRSIYTSRQDGTSFKTIVSNISPYLVAGEDVYVQKHISPISDQLSAMIRGNIPVDGGHLYLDQSECKNHPELIKNGNIRLCLGSEEFIGGKLKYCLWINDDEAHKLTQNTFVQSRLSAVSKMRLSSPKEATRAAAAVPHRFFEKRQNGTESIVCIPAISSENREFLPVGILRPGDIITGKMYGILNAPIWNMSLIASRLHWVWIGTVCVRMRTDFSYSNTLGWNTFPVPKLTEKNKEDLTKCAEDILLAREAHFPATIADLYSPDAMPENLRAAHDRNDETLERIYIGRRFRNDTERLEKLFELYTKMTTAKGAA